MWWDPQAEQRQSIDRLHSRLLTSRLSRQDACMQGARRGPGELEADGGEKHVEVPAKPSAAVRAEAMRLTVAVPGSGAGAQVDAGGAKLSHDEERMGRETSRESEDDADRLTPLDSAKYVMHRKVQEVIRRVGSKLNKVKRAAQHARTPSSEVF